MEQVRQTQRAATGMRSCSAKLKAGRLYVSSCICGQYGFFPILEGIELCAKYLRADVIGSQKSLQSEVAYNYSRVTF